MLIFWLSLSLAHAIENLDCPALLTTRARTVVGKTYVRLKPNQFVVRGKLEAFHEQGMEGNVGWSIFDEDYDRGVFSSPYDALHMLKDGDDVFLIDDDGRMTGHYYFGSAKDLPRAEAPSDNPPLLFSDRRLRHPAFSSRDAARLFEQKRRAVVVLRGLDERHVHQLRQSLGPKYQAYRQFVAEGGRQLVFSGGQSLNLRHYDKVYAGPFKKVLSDYEGRYHYFVEDHGREIRAEPDAMLVFVGLENMLLGTLVIGNWPIPEAETHAFDRLAKKLIIIQREK